jgi:hypothetical protein
VSDEYKEEHDKEEEQSDEYASGDDAGKTPRESTLLREGLQLVGKCKRLNQSPCTNPLKTSRKDGDTANPSQSPVGPSQNSPLPSSSQSKFSTSHFSTHTQEQQLQSSDTREQQSQQGGIGSSALSETDEWFFILESVEARDEQQKNVPMNNMLF